MTASASARQAPESSFSLEPYAYSEARALAQELGLPEPVAVTLVRRGYRTVDAARAFLDAGESHDPFEFDGMAEVVERLRAAASSGRQITVHGDYDADGVCSTTILVCALRALGARCDWFIPDRLADGYGLTAEGIDRLRERGTELLITTDCGITSAGEVGAAIAAGMEVIVTDHHQPEERLPDCPILHPVVSDYPCADLCATGVAYKLSAALQGDEADSDLDLVALATVADLVPLRGENRALVRRGLVVARRARRPGMRALMAAARIESERLDEGDLAFRLAPRINAAGRLYRADAGVELMLTGDLDRAEEIATELDRVNHERRDTETEVLRGAEAAWRELPPDLAEAPGLVVAGLGWHPGVVGIVASRLVESSGRPVVLIAVDDSGRGRGSGRSVPGFDLLAGLQACGEHLARFGGHRAAAGLEIEADRIPAFREAFAAHAREALGETPAVPSERIDAVVGTDELGRDVAEQLTRLGPFGKENPPVRLIVPAARVRDVRPMGEGDRHARFSLEGATGRARGVAFGVNGGLEAAADRPAMDVSVSLELNHWNGAVEPRVVLGEIYEGEPSAGAPEAPAPGAVPAAKEWDERLASELARPPDGGPDRALVEAGRSGERRSVIDRRGHSGVAAVAALASSGESVLVLCADALRRRGLVESAAVPQRFGGGRVAIAAGAGADEAVRAECEAVASDDGGGVGLADWARLGRDPGLAPGFAHLVLIDPPPLAALEDVADRSGPGFLHLAWSEAEVELSLRLWDAEWPSRPLLGALFRDLRDAAGSDVQVGPERLRAVLRGSSPLPRSPEVAARSLRVLLELGVVGWHEGDSADAPRSIVVSSEGSDLSRSQAFSAYRERQEEGLQYLRRRRHPN
ncbi:MAG: single-stranded-DNA-specific exonuclease RecJ [bacterium]